MYARIPWKLIADPLGFAEHTLETTYKNHRTTQFIHVCTKTQWNRRKLKCGWL